MCIDLSVWASIKVGPTASVLRYCSMILLVLKYSSKITILFRIGGHLYSWSTRDHGRLLVNYCFGLREVSGFTTSRYRGFTDVSLFGYGNTASRKFDFENHEMRWKHAWIKDYYNLFIIFAIHLCITRSHIRSYFTFPAPHSNIQWRKEKLGLRCVGCDMSSPGKVISRSRSLRYSDGYLVLNPDIGIDTTRTRQG